MYSRQFFIIVLYKYLKVFFIVAKFEHLFFTCYANNKQYPLYFVTLYLG